MFASLRLAKELYLRQNLCKFSKNISSTNHGITVSDKLKLKKERKEKARQERLANQQKKLENKKGKQTSSEAYDPTLVESKWYDHWMHLDLFNADANIYKDHLKKQPEHFSIILPPPNITGSLHIGHALACTIQDAICRWHRMNGRLVSWIPGCDHAGIATQVVVEKHIDKKLGKTRQELGRERFNEEIWKWKEVYGGRILEQLKSLGCSLDWSRCHFTLDKNLSEATIEAFMQLYKEGLIYRSERLVNWCCALKSTVSDVEVDNIHLDGITELRVPGYEHPITFGTITTFDYPLTQSAETVSVATTRLETMLGDTGLAVHPSDHRYSHLIGQTVKNPLTNQLMPIVGDSSVDPGFGTGAVKVTPAHDVRDFEIARKHELQLMEVIDDAGCMFNVPQRFMGVGRFEARKLVQKELIELGLLKEVKEHKMTLPLCSRTNDVIEFKVKPQWFVKCESMYRRTLEAVENGEIELIPETYEREWKRWLQNPVDWCISRQLWWGHRIPAYQVVMNSPGSGTKNDGRYVVGRNEEEAVQEAVNVYGLKRREFHVVQDDDVLDTWFSSALLPFSVFGWPQKTADLNRLFPTDLLETASDIMFFWVARMVMMSHSLTGKLPFKKVLFHSVVQDSKGRKMSKSLGNVIDPMHVINGVTIKELLDNLEDSNLRREEVERAGEVLQRDFPMGIQRCGADALRFSLASYHFFGHFTNVDMERFKQSTAFCNKIWNSYKLYRNILKQHQPPSHQHPPLYHQPSSIKTYYLMDRWILNRLHDVMVKVTQAYESYQLFHACSALEEFWRLQFCNVYLECVKSELKSSPSSHTTIFPVLGLCFDTFLKVLHPIMPFITEHIYQQLNQTNTISLQDFPKVSTLKHHDRSTDEQVDVIQSISSSILSFQSLASNINIQYYIEGLAEEHIEIIKSLTRLPNVHDVVDGVDLILLEHHQNGAKVFFSIESSKDQEELIKRIKNKMEKLKREETRDKTESNERLNKIQLLFDSLNN